MESRKGGQRQDDGEDDVTDSDEDTVTIGEREDDDDACTVVNDDLDGTSGLLESPEDPQASLVKVAVTVNGKSQLLALDQRLPLDEVCRGLCADFDIRWKAARYALALIARPGGGVQKYISEHNRGELLRHGAELVLTWAPGVFADLILDKLKAPEERPWALQKLSELCADSIFLAALLERPGVVDLVLGLLLNERKGQRLRSKELVWALTTLRYMVRQGALSGDEPDLTAVMRRLADLVRAEQSVDAAVLEMALRVLATVSAQPWGVSAAQHLTVLDVLPMLWYTDKPGVQTYGLELMNVLSAREARLGPGSPEAKMQATKTLTSPQVCATIVQHVLCSPVRSNMARQLFNLQRLVLQPLQEAIDTQIEPILASSDPPPTPPPRRRKSAATSLLHSRSWCEGDAAHGDRAPVPVHGGDRRSLDEAPYKLLPPTRTDVHAPLLRPASAEVLPEGRLSPATGSTRDSTGSVTSLTSDDSAWSRRSQSTLWSELPAEDMTPEAEVPLSRLGRECLRYLQDYHPGLAVRALEEEEALDSSLSATAERLVRLLGAELLLCRDLDRSAGTPASAKTYLYQPLLFSRDVPFFHELFCRGINLLAKTRREMRAKTKRDQDKVFRVVRRQFREALRAQVSSWDQLDSWLSALPYSAVAALWERERVSAEQDTLLGSGGVLQLRERCRARLYQLVRQQRLDTLRAGARFRRPGKLARTGVNKGLKRAPVWLWLAPGDAALLYADCPEDKADGELAGAPLSLPLSSVTAVLTGKKCKHIWTSRSHKQGVDLALSLTLDPHDSEAPSLDLIAKDAPTLLAWADGLNMLLGKNKAENSETHSQSVKRDLDELTDMEIRLQLMELDGVTLPSEPPPIPPPPPDYDFATD
ncbi:Engulfment and cell motility protein 1 [Frankliniella fusca]|uniref:Engulfment and cell motility protein 1 n=1 Tax=Frankliniella fusca TaxID=407009 RepID=A0AAE1HL32_9NEOP|nr:Engulfment and cell motility protein 1 [Frankliniella fusca]